MCGIFGIMHLGLHQEEWEQRLNLANQSLAHRGPDDAGIWYDPAAGIGFSHRRLAILDLSPMGHQPMVSQSGRYVIIFNGEIFNFLDIKKELVDCGYSFRGDSDTEVLLCSVEAWGLDETINKAVGQFALALWDRHTQVLHLVRDRLGIKPLYYGWIGSSIVFASELKAIKTYPGFLGEVDRNSLALYLRHSYVPSPNSIYKNIYKLPPATKLDLRIDSTEINSKPNSYWSANEVALKNSTDPFLGTLSEASEIFENLLLDAVKIRMIADVPLGAFLSGGVDSSMIVAMMQAQSTQRVKTFSIGFEEKNYNEAGYAKDVAGYLGTDHTELYITPEEAMAVIPKLPQLFDEPFADSSQIPTYLVSALARRDVTVSLSGDGGDELFGGYRRYSFAQDIWDKMDKVPALGRQLVSNLSEKFPWQLADNTSFLLAPFFKKYGRSGRLSDKAAKLAEVLAFNTPSDLYTRVVSHWKTSPVLRLDNGEPLSSINDYSRWVELPDFIHQMMYVDMVTYLPDDILVKVDRASMGVSLEARVPMIDHRVVEFVWRLPLSYKVHHGENKYILRQLLYKYVPKDLIDRPKMGFGVPIDSWLRKPLRDWAENLLDENRLHQEAYLDPKPIRKKWNEHLKGEKNWSAYLWDVLMFQAWLEVHSNNAS